VSTNVWLSLHIIYEINKTIKIKFQLCLLPVAFSVKYLK